MEGAAIEGNGFEPIVKTGSSNDITSFDDLETVIDAPKPRKALDNSESGKQKADSKAKAKSSKKEALSNADPEEEGDLNEEEDSNKGDETKKKDANKDKEKPQEGNKDTKDKQLAKAKLFKIKNGDQEIDLRSDSQFEVTIDGQKQTVTAQDLVNEFSGKTSWNKKYSQLDTERKQFETNKQELESGVQTWSNLAKTDHIAAIEYACEISGMDSRAFIKGIRDQFKQAFEEYAELSPEQRKERELSDERDYYKSKAEKNEADRFKQREQADLDKRVKATQAQYNLEPSRYVSRYEELRTLHAQGLIKDEITPELVGVFHKEMEERQLVTEIINETSPELEDKTAASKQLKELWDKDPSLTAQDIRHIAAQVYGSDAAKRLAKKVKKSNPQVQAAPRAKASTNEPTFFDDL